MAGLVLGLFHHRFANLFREHAISSRKGVDSLTNLEQIKARIERSKARKAAKREARARGSWRENGSIDLELLTVAANDAARRCFWHGKPIWEQIETALEMRTSYAEMRIWALDKVKSRERRLQDVTALGNFRSVFTIQNLMKSLQKRRKGVEWKGNVQRFIFHAILKLKRLKDSLLEGKLNVDATIRRIMLHERGKLREIHAVMIDCRVVQGCYCDSCLVPLTERTLIRDNPASVKGKGVTDARNRLEMFLKELAAKHGNDFYIMTGDFTKFFDHLRHRDCLTCFREIRLDRMLQGLGMKIARMYQENELDEIADEAERAARAQQLRQHKGIGLTLGSQESQTMALVIPNRVDHTVKDKMGIRAYERYMDDTLAAGPSKVELKGVEQAIQSEGSKVGLSMNAKKTAITKASKGMKFLQIQYKVTETGHLVKNLARAGIVRMRRKLKKFAKMVQRGIMRPDDAFASFSAWFGNSFHADAYHTRKRMLSLYWRLFHGYRMKGVFA